MKIETEIIHLTVKKILEDIQTGKIEFPIFQRGYVWSEKQSALYIESLTMEFYGPSLYMAADGDKQILLDGMQRLHAIEKFVEGQLPVNIENHKVTFNDLTDKEKAYFLGLKVPFVVCRNMNHENYSDLFLRLNSFTPVSSLIRERAESNVIEHIQKLAKHPFFQECYPYHNTTKTFVDEQLVVILSMLFEETTEIKAVGKREIENYLAWLSENKCCLKEEVIIKIADYLQKVSEHLNVRERRKIFKKLDTTSIFLLADWGEKKNIEPKYFALFLVGFFLEHIKSNDFLEHYNYYKDLRKKGNTKITNIRERATILKTGFLKYWKNHSN